MQRSGHNLEYLEQLIRKARPSGMDADDVTLFADRAVDALAESVLGLEHCYGQAPECDHYGRQGEAIMDCDRNLEELFNTSDFTEAAWRQLDSDMLDFLLGAWADLKPLRGDPRLVAQKFALSRHSAGNSWRSHFRQAAANRLHESAKSVTAVTVTVQADGTLSV